MQKLRVLVRRTGLPAAYSSHSSISVTPGRLSSWWIDAKSGGTWRSGAGRVGRSRASSASSGSASNSAGVSPAASARRAYLATTPLETAKARAIC